MDQETRELAFSLSYGYCMCSKDCMEKATEIHHKLDSIFNLCPINHDCHMTKPLPKISEHEAEIFERWLKKFKGECDEIMHV